MEAQDYFNQLEPMLQQGNRHLQDFEDAEETLSLCDLVETSNSDDDWRNNFSNSKEDCQRASDDQDIFEFFSQDFTAASNAKGGCLNACDDQDHFEFFREDFTASSTAHQNDSIIFCGKIIPHKEPAGANIPEQTQKKKTSLIKNKKQQQNNQKQSRIFPWRSYSGNKSSRRISPKAEQQEKNTRGYKPLSTTCCSGKYGYYEYDYSLNKVATTALSAAPVKSSRWYLLAFGIGRFPAEMELRDIKKRQSRRIPGTMFRSDGGGKLIEKRSEKISSSLWSLLNILGCKSQQANAVVKASFGCIHHV